MGLGGGRGPRARSRSRDRRSSSMNTASNDTVAVASPAGVVLADTVTALDATHHGVVLVTGSHGGLIAAYLAARAGVRAVIFNDAGAGLDDAGLAGIDRLERQSIAAATVAHTSARIADAADTYANG